MSIDSEEELKPLKLIVSSFSEFMEKSRKDIYTGEEKIPFNKCNDEYQNILIYEFKEAIKQFLRDFKI